MAAAAQGKWVQSASSNEIIYFSLILLPPCLPPQSIDEFSKTHTLTLGAMEQLLQLLAGHKALRPADADVELKKSAQLHTHVQRSIEAAIEMGKPGQQVCCLSLSFLATFA